MAPKEKRLAAWKKLAHDLDAAKLERITQEITLAQAISKAPEILDGKVRGRLVVNVNA
jgi:acrylyl-CoA reductase (NADPH)